MQHTALCVHLVEFHTADLRHAQAMPEHQEQEATVSFLLPLVAFGVLIIDFASCRFSTLSAVNWNRYVPE